MKFQSPWMGRVKGSAGNMTGCKVYDKNVLRAKAFEVNNPNTPAQQNQRSFFKEVSGIAATVSEAELRSLFGVKPKAMSRRNALSKQVAAAHSVVDGQKVVDFSKLYGVGNGAAVTTPLVHFVNGITDDNSIITKEMLGVNDFSNTSVIAVIYNVTKKQIQLLNLDQTYQEDFTTEEYLAGFGMDDELFAYLTCEKNGENIQSRDFGSFIIKVRAEKTGR